MTKRGGNVLQFPRARAEETREASPQALLQFAREPFSLARASGHQWAKAQIAQTNKA